jgi:predicted nuclease of restriction endonuclease-like (RecB) superfamily
MTQNMKSIDDLIVAAVCEVVRMSRSSVSKIANAALLETYWHIGRLILAADEDEEQEMRLRKTFVKRLSHRLGLVLGNGFDERNLSNMSAFRAAYPIWSSVNAALSWNHYRILSRIAEPEKRDYYHQQCVAENWSPRLLRHHMDHFLFENPVSMSQVDEVAGKQDFTKDPYIREFWGLPGLGKFSEGELESTIIDQVYHFMIALGKGFAFVARQQRIVTDTSDFHVDLVFYNYILKCFVVVDVKTGPLTHQDIGQIDMYVRMYDNLKRRADDNPTMGILLCTEKDETIVKYSVLAENKQLFANKYLLFLPEEEELRRLIEHECDRIM